MKSLALMRADADQHKARLKHLAKELETRALTSDEEREVDGLKADLSNLSSKIERTEYLSQMAADKAPDKEERAQQKRMKDFSIAKIVAHAGGKHVDVGFEKEVSSEAKRNDPYATGDYVIPFEALEARQETREITTGGGSAGATIVDDLRPQQLIPALRNSLVMAQLGAMMISGARSKIILPRVKQTGDTKWLPETGTATESDVAFDSVSADPKKLMALTSWSAQAAMESSVSLEQIIRNELMLNLAHELDRSCLYGQADPTKAGNAQDSNEPSGVAKLIGRISRSGDNAAGGSEVTYEQILALAESVDKANIGMGRRAFLTNYDVKYNLMQKLQMSTFTDSTGYIWSGMGLAGMPTVVSNVVTSNRRLNGDASKILGSDIFYGNWSDLVVVTWGSGVSLLLNEYGAGYSSGNVQLRGLVFSNCLLRYQDAIKYYQGVKT